MPYKRYYKRRGGGNPLKKVIRSGAKAGQMNKKVKVASVVSLARQVKRLSNKMKRDTEVKEYTPTDIYAGSVAQVDGNVSGMRVFQLNALNIGGGSAADQRIGVKVKHIGMSLRFQLTQEVSAALKNRIIVDIWRTTDFAYSDVGLRDVLYDNDSISTVVDANSTRNHDVIKSKFNPDGIFSLIASKRVTLSQDPYSGSGQFQDFKMFVKLSDEMQYAGSSIAVPINYRYFVCIRAQNGNRNTTTASTIANIPITAVNTGAIVRFQTTSYYTDL